MHPRVVRHKLLHAFWGLLAGGVLLTTPLFGSAWWHPERWVSSGIIHVFVVSGWGVLCWLISRRHMVVGQMLFVCGLIPFVAFSTSSDTNLATQLNLQASSRIALMSPLQLFLAMLGGIPAALLGLVLVVLSFWGEPFAQLMITGHQLVLFSIFGVLIHRLLSALEQRHDQLELLNQQLEMAALLEPSTGFRNRRALEQDWKTLEKQPTCFAMWDLDGLKRINDTKGHQVGDAYIATFCTALKNQSDANAKLYRVGGDEFISIHPNVLNLKPLIQAVQLEFSTVSVGWIRLGDHDLDAAILESDALMYKNKTIPLEMRSVSATHA